MEPVKAGKYEARIIDYTMTTNTKGDLQAAVRFTFNDGIADRNMTWYGGFGEKQLKHTLKALVTMGLRGAVEEMADGVNSNILDVDKAVEIEVRHEEYNGKTTVKIAWVNALGGAAFKNLAAKADVKAKLATLNIKGELAALRATMGVKEQPKPVAKPSQPAAVPAGFDPDFDLGDKSL